MDSKLFFSKLTAMLHLGKQLSDVVRVHGGFMHMMYKLNTTSGAYAVKLINPNVIKRPEALGNYAEADRLESMIQKTNVPIVPSMIFDGEKIQKLDGQYFYVYEWFDGKTLKDKDITKRHCQKIGAALSHIHNVDMRNGKYQRRPIKIDWSCYLTLAKAQNSPIFDLLDANKDLFYESQNRGNSAILKIPASMAICHNDMDSKNVLWKDDDFKIIDLECLSCASPYLELFETALCWSGYEACKIDFELFRAFIDAYFGDKPKPGIDGNVLYYSNFGRLEWLEYNVKRALALECSTIEEQELAIGQVRETVEHVIYYHQVKDNIQKCLTEIFVK